MNRHPNSLLSASGMPAIRRLTAADEPLVGALFLRHPLRMLALRMHLEAYGYDGGALRVWGAASAADPERLEGLVCRLNNTFLLADAHGECSTAFAALIDSQEHVAGVRGTIETVTAVQSLLHRYVSTNWEVSTCLRLARPVYPAPDGRQVVRRACMADLDIVAAHYGGAASMYRSRSNVASRIETNRVFIAVVSTETGVEKVRSSALLNVEGNDAGLIGGVFTQPDSRGQGLAAACTAALALDLQKDGKTPVLFYENPIAGRIYRRLGFEECSKWALLYLARN